MSANSVKSWTQNNAPKRKRKIQNIQRERIAVIPFYVSIKMPTEESRRKEVEKHLLCLLPLPPRSPVSPTNEIRSDLVHQTSLPRVLRSHYLFSTSSSSLIHLEAPLGFYPRFVSCASSIMPTHQDTLLFLARSFLIPLFTGNKAIGNIINIGERPVIVVPRFRADGNRERR